MLLQGQRKLHVGFCLKLLEMCFKHVLAHGEQTDSPALDQPKASIERLVQLQSFARGMAPTAAGLDIKPFLAPYLPAQLLLLVITSTRLQPSSGAEVLDAARDLSKEEVEAAVAGMHLAAVEELCLHCNSSNVQEMAELIEDLPSPAVLDMPSAQSTAGLEFEVKLSSSTAYTAAACASVLEMAGLQQGEGESQTEACQDTADYFQCLAPPDLRNLLLWCALDQAHPLLPLGPQLPHQVPADLRLTLLQTGLQVLLRLSEAGAEVEQDGRLQQEANRLEALCDIQQSCELMPDQWGMVEQALEAITTAGGDNASAAVEACVGELVASGLAVSDVLAAAGSLQGLLAVVQRQGEQTQSQAAAAAVVSAVVQRQVAAALAALSTTSEEKLSGSVPAPNSASNNDAGQSGQHMDGVAQQPGGGSLASPAQALAVILGSLRSLQRNPASAEGCDLVSDLRQHVWTALQHDLFSRPDASEQSSLQPERLQLLEAVLALSTSDAEGESTNLVASPGRPVTADRLPALRWQGWRPDEDSSSSLMRGQQMVLVSRSRAVVGGMWPEVALTGQDLANHTAAQELFLRLLEGAGGGEQLHALQGLLEHVWQSGDAIPSDQVSVTFCLHGGPHPYNNNIPTPGNVIPNTRMPILIIYRCSCRC